MAGGLKEKKVLMDREGVRRALKLLGLKIIERNGGLDDVALVGIYTRGVHLARRLQEILRKEEGVEVPLGTVDIALYRDDALLGLPEPQIGPTRLPFQVADKVIVLVDDVLFTGRTTRAALDALVDFGRPRRVQLLVLVDRGHRELPIQPDFVGRRIETNRGETVKLRLHEVDGEEDKVVLLKPDE